MTWETMLVVMMGGYDNSRNHESYRDESCYFRGEYKELVCIDLVEKMVGQKNLFWIVDPHNPWDDSYDDDEDYEGLHTTHYEDEDDLKYESSTHMPYESYDDDFQLELW